MADEKKPKKEKPEKGEAKPEVKTEAKPDAKTEAPAKSDAPKNYSRGEGQKAVSQEYKENWNAIFGKKKR